MNVNQRFFEACSQGNVQTFSNLVTLSGVNINAVTNSSTALTIAIRNSHREIFSRLLNCNDIDVNMKTGEGLTGLHVACQTDNVAAIEALCQHPLVNVNSRSDNGDTPLMLAIIGGHVEAVKKLVTNDQVDLENLDYRDRINFDNGHIVHGFLTILGIIDEAKQERFRMSLNILRLGEASDIEERERTEAEPEADDVKDDLRSILSRVDRLRGDLMAKMCDYDEKKAHVDGLKRKHDRETASLVSRHLRETQALETRHSHQLSSMTRRQTEERAQAEEERRGMKQELAELRESLGHLLDNTKEPAPPCPSCPVCFESLAPPVRILQCINGHLVCERCRAQPQIEVRE